eukprot:UN01672
MRQKAQNPYFLMKIFQEIKEKEKTTCPYHFKKFDFPKGIPLQKPNF